MNEELSSRLAKNLRRLRQERGATQAELSRLAGVPRATWTHLESGGGNPTLDVVFRVSHALQVSLEELLQAPKSSAQHFRARSIPSRKQGRARFKDLMVTPPPGNEFCKLELPKGARVDCAAHTAGSREYLVCESGELTLRVAGDEFVLPPGDVAVFRGDQTHTYENTGASNAVAYCVVLLNPGLA